MEDTEDMSSTERFYRRRIEWLKNLRLTDLMNGAGAVYFSLAEQPLASVIAADLLIMQAAEYTKNETPLDPGEPADEWEGDFMLDYETERDNTVNRLTRDFLSRYANSDGYIDWEKLRPIADKYRRPIFSLQVFQQRQ